MKRFFLATDNVYSAFRAMVDGIRGYPNAHTVSCLPPPEHAMRWTDGRIVVPFDVDWFSIPGLEAQITAALESGALAEVTEEEFRAAQPVSTMP